MKLRITSSRPVIVSVTFAALVSIAVVPMLLRTGSTQDPLAAPPPTVGIPPEPSDGGQAPTDPPAVEPWKLDVVRIPEASPMLGSRYVPKPTAKYQDEKPLHGVHLSAFGIERTEVTVEAYGRCVAAAACEPPKLGGACNWGVAGREQHPMNCVRWDEAVNYCAWVGGRLPTEAEWERAARGDWTNTYPWGADPPSCDLVVMNRGCGANSTWPVGSRPAGASPFGLLDMAGNVFEWVADWYDPGYYASLDLQPESDPQGPSSGDKRVLRGGSWLSDDPNSLRAATRLKVDPTTQYGTVGFRCAWSADSPVMQATVGAAGP